MKINAHDAMVMKIEMLKYLNFDDDLLKLYCPYIPEKSYDEQIDFDLFFGAMSNMLSIVEDKILKNKNKTNLSYSHFLKMRTVCPYCIANSDDEQLNLKCDNCSFGKAHGKCNKTNPRWVSILKKIDSIKLLSDFPTDTINKWKEIGDNFLKLKKVA